jgi:hypothetical protein
MGGWHAGGVMLLRCLRRDDVDVRDMPFGSVFIRLHVCAGE